MPRKGFTLVELPAVGGRKRDAFTLVELLVSIAVIAVLMALLLPALRGARESARRVQCAANLRALSTAIQGYCEDNRGLFPGIASVPQLPWDWIYWAPSQGFPFTDFGKGPLIRYLASPKPATFRCPSDDWTSHVPHGPPDPYPYSYLLNGFVANVPVDCCSATGRKCVRVRGSSDKLLLVEGDERTIHSGLWLAGLGGEGTDDLADRHDRHSSSPGSFRTNVAFVDCHVEFVPRSFADDSAHYLSGSGDTATTLDMPYYFLR
jgi:prepilin-type N-terminal cleavage/methylation domain-containing protein/prepilin-type processing-associated H-X9-DG protein